MTRLTAGAQLAQWIEQEHPELFQALYEKAVAQGLGAQRVRMRGLGDDGFSLDTPEISLDSPTVDFSSPSFSMPDVSSFADSGDDSVSWLSSIGSGISNAASNMGSWLTSSAGLSSLTNLTTALVKNNTQQQVLAGQVQRAVSGSSPAPITYVQGTNGQVIPVVTQTAAIPIAAIQSGQVRPVTLSNGTTGYAVNSDTAVQVASGWIHSPWLWVGAALLTLAIIL